MPILFNQLGKVVVRNRDGGIVATSLAQSSVQRLPRGHRTGGCGDVSAARLSPADDVQRAADAACRRGNRPTPPNGKFGRDVSRRLIGGAGPAADLRYQAWAFSTTEFYRRWMPGGGDDGAWNFGPRNLRRVRAAVPDDRGAAVDYAQLRGPLPGRADNAGLAGSAVRQCDPIPLAAEAAFRAVVSGGPGHRAGRSQRSSRRGTPTNFGCRGTGWRSWIGRRHEKSWWACCIWTARTSRSCRRAA